MANNLQKFSVVYVSSGERLEVFRSIEEMPEDLRQKLIRTARTSEVNTLVIANEKGRQFLEAQGFSKPDAQARNTPMLWIGQPWMRYTTLAVLASGLGALLVWLFSGR